MKKIVCFSGGHSSALAAIETARKYGTEGMVLLKGAPHSVVFRVAILCLSTLWGAYQIKEFVQDLEKRIELSVQKDMKVAEALEEGGMTLS